MEGARPRNRPKKTWTEMAQKDWKACKLNRKDVFLNRNRWRKVFSVFWLASVTRTQVMHWLCLILFSIHSYGTEITTVFIIG